MALLRVQCCRSTKTSAHDARRQARGVHPDGSAAARSETGLPLYPPRSVAAHELLDLGHADAVEVARDRVLEAARRHGELERLAAVVVGVEAVNQAGRERIATAHAVHDVRDVVAARDVKAVRVAQ